MTAVAMVAVIVARSQRREGEDTRGLARIWHGRKIRTSKTCFKLR
jgi:hypothetical protein